MWSETTVMLRQQRSLCKQATPHAAVVFGAPAMPRKGTPTGDATGTAICAHKPFYIREEENCRGDLFHTGRYLFTLMFLPNGNVFRLVCIYGHTNNKSHSKMANAQLFNEIKDILHSLLVFPTVFAGDFNCNPYECGELKWILEEHWLNATSLFQGIVPTYKGPHQEESTLDYAFLNGPAACFLSHAFVEPLPSTQGHAAINLIFRSGQPFNVLAVDPNYFNTNIDTCQTQTISCHNSWFNCCPDKETFESMCEYNHEQAFKFLNQQAGDCFQIAFQEVTGKRMKHFKRGAHNFSIHENTIRSICKHPTDENTASNPHSYKLHCLVKQQRRIIEISNFIKKGQIILANQTIDKLNKCPFTKPCFLSWLAKVSGTLTPDKDNLHDADTWNYAYRIFEIWLDAFQKKLRKATLRLYKKRVMEDWSNGGAICFKHIKSNPILTNSGATIHTSTLHSSCSVRKRILCKSIAVINICSQV